MISILPVDDNSYPRTGSVCITLVDNAVQCGEMITPIRFSEEGAGDGDIIACGDDGAGIPAGEKEKNVKRGFDGRTGQGPVPSRKIPDIPGISPGNSREPGRDARSVLTIPKGMGRAAGEGA